MYKVMFLMVGVQCICKIYCNGKGNWLAFPTTKIYIKMNENHAGYQDMSASHKQCRVKQSLKLLCVVVSAHIVLALGYPR